ncbi:organoarsenical effux MFS transporter ArsJ [Geoalkalibacter halelectricus]|uniref:Organoarsenical effux MFS transporter ArsJ n=1 Tax=Geoalkalibacter halelectricus TaxID=2847045 RepID=A0ABY5ZGH9_9BACT|nr:organoarsenical effux MFS transporter ArsJ [Geoalkalibacter halelectricus]MDO3380190.1 organoarsenical effux MFS transporter ArsJ [Geoalkalibacter halelectricus]UWZ78237.1 organoarsenical effux MFS transporter ArsJ [Geoalkalibacter halelectricus]
MTDLRNYALVTGAYWGFTLTDGALRMLVLLHFHQLGYSPVQIAFLFLFYEFFGILTNLIGGWIGSHLGLKVTLFAGLALQVLALGLLALLDPTWSVAFSVVYVMGLQALSGIAKDLTKMSSKSAIKVLVPQEADSTLFKWVAILTGSKNALKGAGFFLGGLLLATVGFRAALLLMAGGLALVLLATILSLPGTIGMAKKKTNFSAILSKSRDVNLLSAARLFLFGSRDIWFVVALPVYLSASLGWGNAQVGGFLALWVIGYGGVQALAPLLLKAFLGGGAPRGGTAGSGAFALAALTALIALGVTAGVSPWLTVVAGLALFGVLFAVNSSVHSYLILAYSEADHASLNVGFYYMANAAGRLVGTLLSGLVFQFGGLVACLWVSAGFVVLAGAISLLLPRGERPLGSAGASSAR